MGSRVSKHALPPLATGMINKPKDRQPTTPQIRAERSRVPSAEPTHELHKYPPSAHNHDAGCGYRFHGEHPHYLELGLEMKNLLDSFTVGSLMKECEYLQRRSWETTLFLGHIPGGTSVRPDGGLAFLVAWHSIKLVIRWLV